MDHQDHLQKASAGIWAMGRGLKLGCTPSQEAVHENASWLATFPVAAQRDAWVVYHAHARVREVPAGDPNG